MGPALQAAFLAMQDFGGKLLLFQNAVPSLGRASRISHVNCASPQFVQPTYMAHSGVV